MHFFNDAEQRIHDCDEWMRLAPPAAATHVAEGRSAVEMCRAWMEGDAIDRVTALLSQSAGHGGVSLERGIVEKRTQFDDNPRGPRHHDLLVTAASLKKRIVIGVEGKADEPFGDPLGNHVRKALRGSPASGTPHRVDQLTTAFFGTTLGADPSLATVGYQLLSALAGTLVNARDLEAAEAVLLVHEFRTDHTDDHLHDANAAAFDAFLARLHPRAVRHGDGNAWISDMATLRGDGRWLPAELPVRVGKLRTGSRAPA